MKSNRGGHVGKNSYEKEAYKNFLKGHFNLDKTEEDPENFSKSDSSTFEKEQLNDTIKTQKKSFKLKIKDFFQNNWVISICAGLIVAIIIGVFSMYNNQSLQNEKISNLEKESNETNNKVDKLSDNFSILNNTFTAFQVGLSKDIEYIKKGFK